MPMYLPPDKVMSCACKSRRQQAGCSYGHPDECHYPLSCTEAACGYLGDQGYTQDEISAVTEASKKRIESLSSTVCSDCGGKGRTYHKLYREMFNRQVPLDYVQVCHCVMVNVTGAKARRRTVNTKQVEQEKRSKKNQSFSGELDLHGLRVEEALTAVDRFLSSAQDNDRGTVVIIHGKGHGILRDAVSLHLKLHPSVSEFSPDSEDAVVHVTLRKR